MCYALRPTIFEYQATLSHVHWMTPNDPEYYKVNGAISAYLLSPKFQTVSFYG